MRCGLLGEHLTHSYSPQIHALLGEYSYELFEVAPDALAEFLRSDRFDCLNVTIPYKRAVVEFCATLSDAARELGSVNTLVRRPDGSLHGENTDLDGFRWLLERNGGVQPGEKALVLGTGGASQTVQAVLRAAGAEVTVLSRHGEQNYSTLGAHADATLVVNATPVGMYPNNGARLIDLDLLPQCRCVLDLIYNPARTRLLLDAEERKIRRENGLSMLVAQAKRAAELFTGEMIPDAVCTDILRTLEREMHNVILIGMPGCGKTSVGTLLAQRLGRPFFDADAEIERRLGCTIPAFFAREGENSFRAVETQVLAELGKRSGCVIATGGGCVTRPENYELLHQNGTLVWLRRDLSALPVEGRPISRSRALSELYREREPLYRRFADICVENDDTEAVVAEKIKELLL